MVLALLAERATPLQPQSTSEMHVRSDLRCGARGHLSLTSPLLSSTPKEMVKQQASV